MTFFIILAAIHVIFLGAVYGRLDGGGIAKTKEWIERTLIMFFFVAACAPFADYWAVLAYIGVVGIATGHGQYFLPPSVKNLKRSKEFFDPIVSLVFGKDPRATENLAVEAIQQRIDAYGSVKLNYRCLFGMFVTGSLVGLPSVILSAVYGQYLAAFVFGLTGFAKALAYVISYKINERTEIAEYLNGALRNVICLIVLFLTFGA